MVDQLLGMAPIAAGVVATGGLIAAGYVKAPPDTAYIISGLRKENKVLIGRAGIKVPFFERLDYLSLKLIPLDVKTSSAVPTSDCIDIYVDANVNVKVDTDPELIKVAAKNFLNKDLSEIGQIVQEVLMGNIREIVCAMSLRELIGGQQKFSEEVIKNVVPDLKNMGLSLVNFNVQGFHDEKGIIENLGIDNISQIQKGAAIAKAQAEKEVEIAKAEAQKESNDARVAAETEIAMKNNDLSIKQAELKKNSDTKKAEADAAYAIQEEEQRKVIEVATANANLARQEKELELKERNVAIKKQELDAEIRTKAEAEKHAIEKKAEADRYKREMEAEATLLEQQKAAEAEAYAAVKEAEATKANAEAERFAREEEAKAIRAMGLAEAEAIQAKGEAEAQAVLKKAEAMKEYGEAATKQMELEAIKVIAEQLPKMAAAIGEGYGNVDSIMMYGGDSAQLGENITKTISQVSSGLKDSMGIDLSSVIAGFIGGKMGASNSPVVVESDAAPVDISAILEKISPNVSPSEIVE